MANLTGVGGRYGAESESELTARALVTHASSIDGSAAACTVWRFTVFELMHNPFRSSMHCMECAVFELMHNPFRNSMHCMEVHSEVAGVVPRQFRLFTPDLQWQSGGERRISQGRLVVCVGVSVRLPQAAARRAGRPVSTTGR